jgi:iron(III) transport system ATP-binding protein
MLRITGLRKTFGSGPPALDGVDLDIAEGRIATLVGPSGCGKSTTLRCVAGLERADAGAIEVGGRLLFDAGAGVEVPAAERGLGLVAQSFALWPHLDAAATVAFPLTVGPRSRRPPRREVDDRVERALALVGLEGLGGRRPAELSGGQQQRLALARALVVEPPLLLMDEPFASLDAALRDDLRLELRRLQEDVGVTMLFVTHDQAEALGLANLTIVMRDGRIVQTGKPRQVYEHPADEFVAGFVGRANVLDGVVEDAETVRTVAGPVRVPPDPSRPAGAEVVVAVRGEQVAIDPTEGAEGERGVVRARSFRGDAYDHLVDVAGLELRARTDTSVSVRPGTPVRVRVVGCAVLWSAHSSSSSPTPSPAT